MTKINNSLSGVLIAAGALIFYACAMPILDGLAVLARTQIEAKITKINLNSACDQEEINEIATRVNGGEQTPVIGFTVPDNEMEVEYEDD